MSGGKNGIITTNEESMESQEKLEGCFCRRRGAANNKLKHRGQIVSGLGARPPDEGNVTVRIVPRRGRKTRVWTICIAGNRESVKVHKNVYPSYSSRPLCKMQSSNM